MKSTINNFFEYSEKLSAGGQPSVEQLEALKANGVEAILNISPDSAKNFLQEESKTVEQMKMIYVHFPIDCSNLQKHHFPIFKHLLNELSEKKTFVHCGGNIKTSNIIHMYQVIENKKDEKTSLEQLKKIQNPEQKWFEYFKGFGMKEVN